MKISKQEQLEERIAHAVPFDVDPEIGLSKEQVAQRYKAKLNNAAKKHPTKTIAQILIDNLFNFLNILLFVIFLLMINVGLPWTNYGFAFILFINIGIGIYQDIHARVLVDRLKVVADPKARVVREGHQKVIPSDQLVLDDIIILSAGDQIMVDCEVVGGACEVNESLLTGESRPVAKKVGDSVLGGTYVVKGTVRARVRKISIACYAETLHGKASHFSRPASEIRRSSSALIGLTGIVATVIGVSVYLTYGIQTNDWLGYFSNKTEIASMSGSLIAMLPAGMFLLASTALTVGVINLSKRRMLVQELYCIEVLARVDVLCLDKTGTLTDGSMNIDKVQPFGKHAEEEISKALAAIVRFTGDSNSTARAVRNRFGIESDYPAIETIPFDSSYKYSAVTLQDGTTYCFGAYGFVPLKNGEVAEGFVKDCSSRGLRVIVVARSNRPISNGKCPKDMELLGAVSVTDHIKADAPDTIAWFQNNDVAVRVISGDDPLTVSEIAKRCGVMNANRYVSLAGKTDLEVAELAKNYVVFGRVSPEQKAILIQSFKKQGHRVAMTGDGVNDILALKVADCSIAMASGSDAAKSVSHLISLDDDFSKLPDVVHQGRRVINNLQRSCSLFLNKAIFAMIVSVIFLFSSWAGGRLYPFIPSNMLIWELLAIGLPSFFYALQPSNERLRGSFLENIFERSLPAAISVAVVAMLPLVIAMIWPEAFSFAGSDPDTIWNLAVSMSVLLMTIQAFICLGKISFPPFSWYRLIVFIASVSIGAAIFILDGTKNLNLLGISFEGLHRGYYILLAILSGVGVGVYAIAETISIQTLGKGKKEIKKQ